MSKPTECIKPLSVESAPEGADSNEGVLVSIANLINLAVGVGIVFLPGAFCQTGWVLGFFMLSASAYIAHFASLKIVEAKMKTGLGSLDALCQQTLGNLGFWLLNISF